MRKLGSSCRCSSRMRRDSAPIQTILQHRPAEHRSAERADQSNRRTRGTNKTHRPAKMRYASKANSQVHRLELLGFKVGNHTAPCTWRRDAQFARRHSAIMMKVSITTAESDDQASTYYQNHRLELLGFKVGSHTATHQSADTHQHSNFTFTSTPPQHPRGEAQVWRSEACCHRT